MLMSVCFPVLAAATTVTAKFFLFHEWYCSPLQYNKKPTQGSKWVYFKSIYSKPLNKNPNRIIEIVTIPK